MMAQPELRRGSQQLISLRAHFTLLREGITESITRCIIDPQHLAFLPTIIANSNTYIPRLCESEDAVPSVRYSQVS